MVATISSALETCLDDTQLVLCVQGALPSEERERVEIHLGRCPACCELLAETAKLLEVDGGAASVTRSLLASPSDGDGSAHIGASVGRYRLVAVLGRGGAGIVYAAHDPELHRRVAIKVLRGDVLERDDDDSRARLLREARAMARVSHPHVVGIYDVGVWADQVFVAMELVEGRTLRAMFNDPSIPWRTRLDRVIEAGRGLSAAHAAGLVHRDFKPENVLVGDDGRARVTDFGLAKPVRGEGDPSGAGRAPLDVLTTVTLSGRMAGTPAYMAPEQFLGAETDARVDQFALCVVLHEALFGARPFAGKVAEDIARNVLESRVTDVRPFAPPDVPEGLRAVVLQGLARQPEARHPSIDALLEAIVKLRDDGPASSLTTTVRRADAAGEGALVAPQRRRRRVVFAAVALATLSLVGVSWFGRSGPDSAPSASSPSEALTGLGEPGASPDGPVEPSATRSPEGAAAVTAAVERSTASERTARHGARVSPKPRGAPKANGGSRAALRSQALGDRVENPF